MSPKFFHDCNSWTVDPALLTNDLYGSLNHHHSITHNDVNQEDFVPNHQRPVYSPPGLYNGSPDDLYLASGSNSDPEGHAAYNHSPESQSYQPPFPGTMLPFGSMAPMAGVIHNPFAAQGQALEKPALGYDAPLMSRTSSSDRSASSSQTGGPLKFPASKQPRSRKGKVEPEVIIATSTNSAAVKRALNTLAARKSRAKRDLKLAEAEAGAATLEQVLEEHAKLRQEIARANQEIARRNQEIARATQERDMANHKFNMMIECAIYRGDGTL